MRYSSVLFPVALIIGAMALAACGGGGSEDESSQADFGVEPEERIEEPQVAGVAEEPGAADVQAEAAREEAEARAEAQAEAQAVAQAEAEPPPVEDLRAAVLAGLRVFEEVTILEIDPLGLPDAGTLRAVHATGMGFSLGPDGGAPEAHFLAIYRAEAASTSSGRAAWQQVARLELESLPDFLVEDAVRQVEIAPGEVWFEGEYAEAVDFLGQYAPEEIFNFEGPLIVGTAAQSWVNVLGGWLVNFASRAVTAQPDLASAHFLLGLGEYFLDPGNGAVIRASVEQAHLLELADVLYALSVVYLLE